MRVARTHPGRLTETELERRFVARGTLLAVLSADLAATVREGGARYVLVAGPAGIGKTHLLAIALHHLRRDSAFTERSELVNFDEESSPRSLHDLWARTAVRLGGGAGGTEADALRALEERLGRRRVLLCVERLDELFDRIGDAGQSRLRGALENHRAWSLVGTARAVGPAFTDRKSPFYQTFVRHVLPAFTVDEGRAMLTRLAREADDAALVEALEGPTGVARVRALQELVGDTPRALATLAPWLDPSALDDPEPLLAAVADDLAPLFAERCGGLPEGQRALVELLASAWRPLSVGELAAEARQTHQVASSNLRRLGELVHAVPAGRERCYELCDPLLALVRGVTRPEFGAFARFLVAWHEPEPRVRWRERLPVPHSADPRVQAALTGAPLPDDPDLGPTRAALACARGRATAVPEGPVLLDNWLTAFASAEAAGPRPEPEVIVRLGEGVGLPRLSAEDRVAWLHAVRTAGDPDRASRSIDEALRGIRDPRDTSLFRIRALLAAGRAPEALAAADRAAQRWPNEATWREWAAASANTIGLSARAEKEAAEAVRIDPEGGRAWYVLGVARSTLGHFHGAALALKRARALLPRAERPAAFLLFGALLGCSRFDEAAAMVDELDPGDRPWARSLLAVTTGDPVPRALPAGAARRYRGWLHGWLAWLADRHQRAESTVGDTLRAVFVLPADDELRAALAVGVGRLAAGWVPAVPAAFRSFCSEVDAVVSLGAFLPLVDAMAELPGASRKLARLAAPERAVVAQLLRTYAKEQLPPET